MVSALASSSVKLPRNVSVKLFVSDCDLFSCGDCFPAPGPEEAGMGPGWNAWLGDVVADRAL